MNRNISKTDGLVKEKKVCGTKMTNAYFLHFIEPILAHYTYAIIFIGNIFEGRTHFFYP